MQLKIFLDLITKLHAFKKREREEEEEECEGSLADHVSRLLVNQAGRAVAAQTLVHLALVSLEPGRAHALHAAAAGQRARLGVHAVVVADVCCTSGEVERQSGKEMSALEM